MTEFQSDENNPKAKRRWLMPLLFVSLALNLLVAGLIVGHTFSPEGKRGRAGGIGAARGMIGEPFVRALPDNDRKALIKDILADRPRIREGQRMLRQRFDAFLSAVRADPYDPVAVAQLLLQQRAVAVGRQEIGEALLMKRLAEMPAEERKAYADRLERSLRRFKRR